MLAEPGFHTRCFVEWEEHPRDAIIAAQRAGTFAPAPIWTDVKSFDGRPYRGHIDTILAGYPCQPFSAAGQRKGEDDPRHLWPDVARIAREIEPEWLFLENVAGHVSLGLEAVLRELCDMGFTPATGLFSAAETGAPHKRERVFIVAHASRRRGGEGPQSEMKRSRPRSERGGGDGLNLATTALPWPTPMARTPAQNGNSAAGNNDFSRKATELALEITNWSTPKASDGPHGGPNQAYGSGGTPPLPAQAAQWQTPVADDQVDRLRGKINSRGEPKLSAQALQWPTPAARDYKGQNGPDHLKNGTGRLHMDQLPNAVAHGFTHPAPVTPQLGNLPFSQRRHLRQLLAGAGFLKHPKSICRPYAIQTRKTPLNPVRAIWKAKNSHDRWTAKRTKYWTTARLNPTFVEWLMGWPTGHALCASSEMEFARWSQRMRGALSRLPTASGAWIWKPTKAEPEPDQLVLF